MSFSDEIKLFVLIPILAGIGIVLAMIVETLYDRGLIIDEYIAGSITLANLQSIIVIIFIVIGILIAAKMKK